MTESGKRSVSWEYLLQELDKYSNDGLQDYLKQLHNNSQKITEIIDVKGFNLLHHAVLK